MTFLFGCAALVAAEISPANHWSFQPVRRPPLPSVRGAPGESRNPIDLFINAGLSAQNLRRSPEADRRTLIRRLSFDLAGLPPAPEDVAAFERDPRPDAYERLVDRLLASSRFGERWARHWLDVVRFAETHGFEMNQPRPNAWPYRDYVIRALNDDKPYDRFVLEQLAGDTLGADEATGFLVAGPWDQVKSPDEVLTRNQRADELHDMVAVTGTTFLGLTLGCARCHDHKFDPIPQRDYYALKTAFEGVQHGDRRRADPGAPAREEAAARAQSRLDEIEAALVEFEPLAQSATNVDRARLRAPVNPRLNIDRFLAVAARRLRFTINATTDAEPCIDELEVFGPGADRATVSGEPGPAAGGATDVTSAHGPGPAAIHPEAGGGSSGAVPRLKNLALASLGVRSSASGTYPNSDLHKLEHLNDGRVGNSRSWISNEKGRGWVELEFPEVIPIERVVWSRDREEKFKDRLATDYRIEVASADGAWTVVASSADRLPYKAGEPITDSYRTNDLDSAQAARLAALAGERLALRKSLDSLRSPAMVYAGEFKVPEPTHRFHRGDPMQPRETIEPGFLSAIAVAAVVPPDDPERPDDGDRQPSRVTPEQRRRLALARWIVSPQNPLTARVIVNRLWQYHFGEGLVATPGDFGRNGAPPAHPELLDWLAAELVARGWSLKHIHRLIVTSAAYRQGTDGRELNGSGVEVLKGPALAAPRTLSRGSDVSTFQSFNPSTLQPFNAHPPGWSRFMPRRMEAEPLRDSILAVAGRLDLRMGGPGWSPFEPNDNYVRVYAPKQRFGPEDFRRMIYATAVRQRPDGVFGAFDCPDGGQAAPKRTRSTTALQALNLLNSGFMAQAAAAMAERLDREAGPEVRRQVRRAFELAYQREPEPDELGRSTDLVLTHGLEVFCRALLNSNEFVYVF